MVKQQTKAVGADFCALDTLIPGDMQQILTGLTSASAELATKCPKNQRARE